MRVERGDQQGLPRGPCRKPGRGTPRPGGSLGEAPPARQEKEPWSFAPRSPLGSGADSPRPCPASKPSSRETVDSSSPSPLLPTPACRPGIARIPSVSTQTPQRALPCIPSASLNFLGFPLQ